MGQVLHLSALQMHKQNGERSGGILMERCNEFLIPQLSTVIIVL